MIIYIIKYITYNELYLLKLIRYKCYTIYMCVYVYMFIAENTERLCIKHFQIINISYFRVKFYGTSWGES